MILNTVIIKYIDVDKIQNIAVDKIINILANKAINADKKQNTTVNK